MRDNTTPDAECYRSPMIVKLSYGVDTLAVDLRGLRVRPLQSSAPRGSRDPGRLLSRAVDYPLEGPSLSEIARERDAVVVVVPDATRGASLPAVLPVILNRLIAAGIAAEAIEILVACGTHPPAADSELGALLGELPRGVTVRQHSSRAAAGLQPIGRLRGEIPLRINRAAAAADLLLTVGSVRHHYFAGFGGGPKMIFPGIAGDEEIQRNHSLVLREGRDGPERDPGCEPGRLEGNPVAMEIAAAADLRPPDFALCLVPGRDGGVAWAGGGPWRVAFESAVARSREWFEIPAQSFQRVVACGGGGPGDGSLIQAHKGLDAACRFAAPGAEVLFVAELGGGAGAPAMEPFLDDPRPEAILALLADRYVQYGHTTLRIVEKTNRFQVHLKSNLDPDLARRLGFLPVEQLDAVADRWRAEGQRGFVGVMSEGAVWPRFEPGGSMT
jgi:nickel-dependent lactate racemase